MTAATRRAALTALAGASVLALPAVAIAAVNTPDADAELIALAAEIDRLCALGDEIYAKRVDPFTDTFQSLMDEALDARHSDPADFDERWGKAWAYSRESGRDAAIKERNEIDSHADRLWGRMMDDPFRYAGWRGRKGARPARSRLLQRMARPGVRPRLGQRAGARASG